MRLTTAWVKPPKPSNGQDHLGIQQPPTRIFSSLLPGVTVSTDRVAYLSFYPWLLSHYAETGLDFETALRRSECLLTLIAEHHTRAIPDAVEIDHVVGLVGRNVLGDALPDAFTVTIPLAAYAELRTPNNVGTSYFNNPLGGLGQYYLGALRELGLLGYDDDAKLIPTERGLALADAFDKRVDRKGFFALVKRGLLNRSDLASLERFCPCFLAKNPLERERLIDILFARHDDPTEADHKRRSTFLLLLDLAARRADLPRDVPLVNAFRGACATSALDDGTTWSVPETHAPVRRAWGIYQHNEQLSVAILGIFWFALELADDAYSLDPFSTSALRTLVMARARVVLGQEAEKQVATLVQQRIPSLCATTLWTDPTHEFDRSFGLTRSARALELDEVLTAATDILLAMTARGLSDLPYAGLGFPPDLLLEYPLNLAAFTRLMRTRWSTMTLAEWLGDLATSWGIEAHLRVAIKKLFSDGRDTFLVHRTDDGLRRPGAEAPLPGFTASRLGEAIRFMVDLGLLTRDDERPTTDGLTLLGALYA